MMPNRTALARNSLLLAMKKKGIAVTLRWETVTGGTVDPTTGHNEGGTVTPQSEVVNGFWYDIEEGGRTKLQQWQNYEVLHAIFEMPPATVVEGRSNFRVEKGGEIFVQAEVADGKKMGKQIERLQGVDLYRTLFLRKAT